LWAKPAFVVAPRWDQNQLRVIVILTPRKKTFFCVLPVGVSSFRFILFQLPTANKI
jgi:hypothetical protein